jgi:hypothetical protein
MLRDLSKLIDDEDSEDGDGDQLQKELRQAAQQLWRAHFIYENDWGMKGAQGGVVARCSTPTGLARGAIHAIGGESANDSTTPHCDRGNLEAWSSAR